MSKNIPNKPQSDALEKLARWDSHVAIGDSFAEGVVNSTDPENPDNLMFSWADRLAWELFRRRTIAGLTLLKYVNLVTRERKPSQITTEQMAIALGMYPALISTIDGGNDPARVSRGLDHLSCLVESMAVSVHEIGVDVSPDTIQDSKGSPTISSMCLAIAEFNTNIWSTVQRYECYVLGQWSLYPIHTMNSWASDRFHLEPIDHELIMNHALRALGLEPCYPEYDQVSRDKGIAKWTSSQNRGWVKNHLVFRIRCHAWGYPSGDGRSVKSLHSTVLDPHDLPTPPVTLWQTSQLGRVRTGSRCTKNSRGKSRYAKNSRDKDRHAENRCAKRGYAKRG